MLQYAQHARFECLRAAGVDHRQINRADGTLAAEDTNVGGLLDLEKRQLVPDPGARWRSVATAPEVLGL